MDKVSKASVNYRPATGAHHCGNCVMFHHGFCDLVKGHIDEDDVCDRWEAETSKSAETPSLEATPDLLGTQGLWHTPDAHSPSKQKLPNYIEHIAHALMRDQGMDESRAIATAINAVKRWAAGHGKPEVVSASQRALAEWEKLKESHH